MKMTWWRERFLALAMYDDKYCIALRRFSKISLGLKATSMSNTKYESANSGWSWVMWNRINWISLVKWVGKMWLLKRELMVLKRLTPFPLFSSSMVNELAVVIKRVLIMLSSLDRRDLMEVVVTSHSSSLSESSSPLIKSSISSSSRSSSSFWSSTSSFILDSMISCHILNCNSGV